MQIKMANLALINLNNCKEAQDLMFQIIKEENISLIVLTEPHTVPSGAKWSSDLDESAAIYTPGSTDRRRLIQCAHRYVIIEWAGIGMVACYISPNVSMSDFANTMTYIQVDITKNSNITSWIIMDDLNAKSETWGATRPDNRGIYLEDWMATLDLRVVNIGDKPTCVRWQGNSIVDVVFATHDLVSRIEDWRVRDDILSLSDHHYIEFTVRNQRSHSPADHATTVFFPRWKRKNLDPNKFKASLVALSWMDWQERNQDDQPSAPEQTAEELAKKLTWVTEASDATMPRQTGRRPDSRVFWWTDGLNELRRICNGLRKKTKYWSKSGRDPSKAECVLQKFREAREQLKGAITKAKDAAWKSLLQTLNEDPWGRTYRIVLQKLTRKELKNMESMEVEDIEQAVNMLFPPHDTLPRDNKRIEFNANHIVTRDELDAALKRAKSGKAPGPDGITTTTWVPAAKVVDAEMTACYNACMKTGCFPREWKLARLVLVSKPGNDPQGPTTFRPLCMLGEIGKILEKMLAKRMNDHITTMGGLSASQYGFRSRLSTVDAILDLQRRTTAITEGGRYGIAIGLDIANAFGSLPWVHILRTMENWNFPGYLQAMIASYLSDRKICFVGDDRMVREMDVTCGVPQGSVLGPLLWNLTYNEVLKMQTRWALA